MIRLKNLSDAATAAIHTGYFDKYEKQDAQNKTILSDLFRRLVCGDIDAVTATDTEQTFYTLTRATRHDGIVKTCFWNKNSEWIPVSHHDSETAEDLIREGLQSGKYELITF